MKGILRQIHDWVEEDDKPNDYLCGLIKVANGILNNTESIEMAAPF